MLNLLYLSKQGITKFLSPSKKFDFTTLLFPTESFKGIFVYYLIYFIENQLVTILISCFQIYLQIHIDPFPIKVCHYAPISRIAKRNEIIYKCNDFLALGIDKTIFFITYCLTDTLEKVISYLIIYHIS